MRFSSKKEEFENKLAVEFLDKNLYDEVDATLAPDNIDFPAGMKFLLWKESCILSYPSNLD